MNRVVNCILMLTYLQTGKTLKISEIVSRLEFDTGEKVNPRNIIEYRKELEYAGYYIQTIPGKFGGYKLDTSNIFPVLKLTDEEKETLVEGYQFINSKPEFVNKQYLDNAMAKIFSSIDDENKYEEYISIEQYQLAMNDYEIKERYNFINKCIKERRQIEINYASLKSGTKTHILHPYKLFLYNNFWFFFAWNPEVGEVWTFKLNRITTFKKLDKKFTIWKGFKPNDYLDEHGFKNNGKWYHLVFIAKGTRASLLKERIYGKNQIVKELDDGSIKVELDMQNEGSVISFALSSGDDILIQEPVWLVEKIKEIASLLLKKYEK